MSKTVALLLVLAFLTSTCIAVKPAISSVNVAENTWVSKASMQQARSSLGVAVVNGKIYAIGGKAENGVVGTNEEYDPETNTWTLKRSMPTPRAGFATAVYQNKIYCIGGSNHTGVNEVYDPVTDSWENKTSMPTARTGLHANVASDKIYLIGGYVLDNNSDLGFSVSNLNEVYDPVTDSWTTMTSIPTGVSIYASAVVDNKIYFIDGVAQSSLSNISRSKLNQIYDAEFDSWSVGTPFPSTVGFYGVAGATTGVYAPKRIYSLDRDFFLSEQPYVGVYDPERDSWSVGAVVPTNRYGLSVAVLNDKLYAIGGYTEVYSVFPWEQPTVTFHATNEQYTPFGYGTVAPEIAVVSPENKTYTFSNVSLAFAVNKPASWMGYSLDGQDNVTVYGNITLSGLANGLHTVTVYARDEFENIGASETIYFTIEEPAPFPTIPVAVASVAAVVVVGVGLVMYFRKRKR
jgi:hypothetical protein